MVVTIVIMNHYVACGWYFVGTNQGEPTWVEFFSLNKTSISYRYTTSLHWSLTQFTPAGMEIYATNQTERIYSVLVLLFAMVIFSWFISSITTALTHLRNLSSEQDKHKLMLRSYFSENDISLELNQRIWHHLQMSYWNLKRRQREKDIAILSYLPETLKSQLREELFMPSLLKVPFLKYYGGLNSAGMRMLCYSAIEECSLVCLEELFTAGKFGENMHFVSGGDMVYARSGSEDEKVTRGMWAAEAVLWVTWTHRGTLRARTSCEAFSINAEKARHIMLEHQESVSIAAQYARMISEVLDDGEHWTDLWSEQFTESFARAACGAEARDDFRKRQSTMVSMSNVFSLRV